MIFLDLLVGLLMALLTGAAILMLQQATYTGQSALLGMNYASTSSRQVLDSMSDTLRNAPALLSGGSYSALTAASASDVTCYSATGTSRFWLDGSVTPAVLRETKTDSNGVATTIPLVAVAQTLQLTYYVPAGGTYTNSLASWSLCTDPNAQLSAIGAVDIQVTVGSGSDVRTLESFVRLRNSPYLPTP